MMMNAETSRIASHAASFSRRRQTKRTADIKAQIARFVRLRESGMTLEQAADTMGVQHTTARRYVQKMNRQSPEQTQARKEEAARKEIEVLQKKLDDGYSVYQAAKAMKADPGRIYNLVKEKNLRVSWERPNGKQGRIRQAPSIDHLFAEAAPIEPGKSKFPRSNFCIVTECKRVYRQEHAGHRMCRDCRNKSW